VPSRSDAVLDFWFGREGEPGYGEFRAEWFRKDSAFDAEVTERFASLYEEAAADGLDGWRDDARSCLALVIVLDQFPRNMFRGDRRTYATDEFARAVADRAIARGFDRQVSHPERQFFYLPFNHSENVADQERCLELARAYGDDEFTKYAEHHAEIIRRFGRFPHRNALLGRATNSDEQAFLDGGGFAG
jgi:uncharacterized protein (DUF924 family)